MASEPRVRLASGAADALRTEPWGWRATRSEAFALSEHSEPPLSAGGRVQRLARSQARLNVPVQEEGRAPASVSAPVVAIVDRLGTVAKALREACPDLGLRWVKDRGGLTHGDEPLVLFAVYEASDWKAAAPIAWSRTTVIVSATATRAEALGAITLGAFGHLSIDIGERALRRSILGALRGEPAYSRATLGDHLRAQLAATLLRESRARQELTPRQRQVVALIANGAADKEIASKLGITPATAQKHVTNVLRRLNVPNRAAAAVAVLRTS